jgi:FkbM family methyltransferase
MQSQEVLGRPFFGVEPYRGDAPAGVMIDWLGMRRSTKYEQLEGMDEDRFTTPGYPPLTEEYWEWIDIFEAVRAAGQSFNMFELGAGYGRWCIAAEGALRKLRPDIPRSYTAVEAEPTHYIWLREHFTENGLDPDRHRLIQAAVAEDYGLANFVVGNSAKWWGQAIVDIDFYAARNANTSDPVIHVPMIPLSALLEKEDLVDLIDMDVQGVEFEIVKEAIRGLNKKVRRLHIGTHSSEIEASLRTLLAKHDWVKNWDFDCLSSNVTPLGKVQFGDGVQSWTNPRLI